MSLVFLFGGLGAAAWFGLGLPPLPAPAYAQDGTSGSSITWGFYGVVVGLLGAFMGLLGLLTSIGD